MKFVRLRITGFKSFVDPVEFHVEPGLTGVVGPNGCGKSNILESLRWVMGAASAKAMRAAGMDDVIFSGSRKRPARNHAEVTLIADNAERRAPAQFNDADTLEITRRISRGAGSVYKVNGAEARARDVQLLFADASSGANSPALVRQGQVSELIAAKPENRRRVLEEAAGVSGLRARRHEAELKLRAAQANLERLDDVVGEAERQLDQLRRQARQARRYRRVSNDILALETHVHRRRWSEAQQALSAAEARLAEAERGVAAEAEKAAAADARATAAAVGVPQAREEEAVAAALHARLTATRDSLLQSADAAENDLKTLRRRVAELTADDVREAALARDADEAVGRIDDERAAAPDDAGDEAERDAAAARLAAAEAARAEAEAARDEAARALAAHDVAVATSAKTAAEADARRTRLTAERAEAERRRAALAAELDDAALEAARTERDASRAASDAAAATRETAESRLDAARAARDAAAETLQEAAAELARFSAEHAALAAAHPADDDAPPVSDEIDIEPGLARAVAAALGDDVTASLAPDAARRWAGPHVRAAKLPEGARRLSNAVKAPAELSARLAATGVVDAADGDRLAAALKPGQRLVSAQGDLWRWDGFRGTPDAPAPAAARLEARARLTALDVALAAAAKDRDAAIAARDAAEKKLAAARKIFAAAKDETVTAQRRASDAAAAFAALERDQATARARLEAAAAEAARLAAELDELEAAAPAAAETGEADRGDLERRLEAAAATLADARDAAAAAGSEFEGLSRRIQDRQATLARLHDDRARWDARRAEAAARRTEIAERLAEARAHATALSATPDARRVEAAGLDDQLAAADARRKAAADALAVVDGKARDAEQARKHADAALAAAREARAAAEARRQAAEGAREQARAVIRDALGLDPDALPPADTGAEKLTDSDAVEARLAKLRRERDGMGAVNLRADEESGEREAALAKLLEDRADVLAAVTTLQGGVDKINAEGRKRMRAAFDVIDAHFRDLFQTLFAGGEARLELVGADDALEAGLEIHVQPPGKKLGSMSLMSGGEQALTATALIFAVFLANPAPLCALDEVDAPLDDANVDRFCNLLDAMVERTDTRFVVITHNAVTMSRMDRLFGVTMSEPGVSQLVSVDLERAERLAAAQ